MTASASPMPLEVPVRLKWKWLSPDFEDAYAVSPGKEKAAAIEEAFTM